MKQETLKKIVELADGFEYRIIGGGASDKIITPSGDQPAYFTVIKSKELYPLLLRRAVEGWTMTGVSEGNFIIPEPEILIDRINWETHKIYRYSNYPKTDYLTPQEQAIEACLIELLEATP